MQALLPIVERALRELCDLWTHIYIYIYRERERERCMYIYIYREREIMSMYYTHIAYII